MKQLQFEVNINGQVYTKEILEFIKYEREKHVLQEMIHLGAIVKNGDKILTYDDINYLHMGEISQILLDTKYELGVEGTRELYKESLEKSEKLWRKIVKDFKDGDSYQESVASMKVTGMTFNEYMESLRKSMNQGENSAIKENPEHFPVEERDGLKSNEKCCMEIMGMYGGPVEVIVQIDPSITGDVREENGFRNMICGTSRLIDGTPRHDIAVHQFRPVENGFELRLCVKFPEKTPKEMVQGHCLHLALEFMGGLDSAQASLYK